MILFTWCPQIRATNFATLQKNGFQSFRMLNGTTSLLRTQSEFWTPNGDDMKNSRSSWTISLVHLLVVLSGECYAISPNMAVPSPTNVAESDPTARPPRVFACTTLFNYSKTILAPTNYWLWGGSASASCCDGASADWSWGSLWYYSDQMTRFYTTSTIIKKYTKEFLGGSCAGPFTTLADGVPRALCSPSQSPTITMDLGVEWVSITSLTTTGTVTPYPFKRPDCEIDEGACEGLWEDYWMSRTSSFKESVSYDLGQLSSTTSVTVLHPACNDLKMRACYDECLFNLDLSLLFWPAIGSNDSRARPSRTIQWGTHALTSPTVYASYSTMTHGLDCGSSHTDVLIPLDPYSIFIINMNPSPGQTNTALSPVNFAHFEYSTVGTLSYPLVPYSEYKKQFKCSGRTKECSSIYHDYGPEIVFRIDPAVLSRIDPEWKRCGNELHTAHDPPIALQSTNSLAPLKITVSAKVTSDEARKSIPAAPQQTPIPIVPLRTGQVTILATIVNKSEKPLTPSADAMEEKGSRPARQVEFVASGGQTVTATQRSDGAFLVEGNAISPGKQTTVRGVAISAFNSGVVVDYRSSGIPSFRNTRTAAVSKTLSRSGTNKTKNTTAWGCVIDGWSIVALVVYLTAFWR